MNILALETSTSACSIALQYGSQVKSLLEIAPMRQTELILPMVKQLLAEACLELRDLDAIAFGEGPGSFTGVRIASSVAQGLAFTLKIPVVSVSSLAILAQSVLLAHGWPKVLVAIDARREQVYWGMYQANVNNVMCLVGQVEVISPEAAYPLFKSNQLISDPLGLHGDKKDAAWYGVGDGWISYGEILNNSLHYYLKEVNAHQHPSAEGLLKLADEKIKAQQFVEASEALPLYLLSVNE